MLNLVTILLHSVGYFHIFSVMPALVGPQIIENFFLKNSKRARGHIDSAQETKHLLEIYAHIIFSFLGILQKSARIMYYDRRRDSHCLYIFFKITHKTNQGFRIQQ